MTCAREGCCNPIVGRLRRVYCSKACRRAQSSLTRARTNDLWGIASGTVGTISELAVAIDLAERGYEVFRAISPSCSCDLIGLRDGQSLRIEVRSGWIGKSGKIGCAFNKQRDVGRHDVLAIRLRDGRIQYRPDLPVTSRDAHARRIANLAELLPPPPAKIAPPTSHVENIPKRPTHRINMLDDIPAFERYPSRRDLRLRKKGFKRLRPVDHQPAHARAEQPTSDTRNVSFAEALDRFRATFEPQSYSACHLYRPRTTIKGAPGSPEYAQRARRNGGGQGRDVERGQKVGNRLLDQPFGGSAESSSDGSRQELGAGDVQRPAGIEVRSL